jgi:beta-N-acetylhexosaminidase
MPSPPRSDPTRRRRAAAAARFAARRRGALAVVATVVATVGIWAVALRDSGGGSGGDGDASQTGVSEPVQKLAANLSPDQLVDQVLLLGFEGADASSPVMTTLLGRQLGGVLIRRRNWFDAGQGAALIAELRAAGLAGGRIPPLIAVSQEGGPYRSLPDLPPAERQLDIGDSGSPRLAERWASTAAASLRGVGIDLNLFPSADVATLDSPVAGRAFSEDPAVAAEMTAAAIRGCGNVTLACAVLHFPGLGAASQDTTQGPATVSLDATSLAARDLAPFRAAFAERVPAVVLSLAFYAAYDPVTAGALSPSIATELLRDELDFQGAAITDDLGAGAIKAVYDVPQAAVAAVQAGADMVQVAAPSDQIGVREALLEALAGGELSESRLKEAAGRVLELKRAAGLLKGSL